MPVSTEVVRGFGLSKTLSEESCLKISAAAVPITFRAGEVFFQQGEDFSALHLVQTGHVKLFRQSGEKIQILAVEHGGGTFGAETLFAHTPCPCTAQALTAGSALMIPADTLMALLDSQPDFMMIFLEVISQKLRQFTNLVHSLAFRDVPTRLAEVLLQQEWMETSKGITIPRILSQQDLAANVGTAREVVYRTLKKFEQDGLIRILPHEYIVLDAGRLLRLADQES
ncbi:MAG: Crp/Fnr family transcriptional regulator [Anaerolineae bacterium]|nr:Crp/Fnr family transcriptional regulator [Anaerolineae bacterium]